MRASPTPASRARSAGRLKAMAGAALLALAGCASSPAPATAAPPGKTALHKSLFAAGVQRFTFDEWAGPAFPVWTFRPAGAGADAPVLFVFHGVRRDADNYMHQWVDLARRSNIVLIVPEYSASAFPGVEAYSHGWLSEKDGSARPRAQWSFATVEPIFAAVKRREGLSASTYSLYGHSGGAQFVHRYVLAGGGPHLARAVSANAGSYAATDPAVDWPFGLGGLPAGMWDPEKAFAVPMLVLLGTRDDDPGHQSLPRQPEAMAQGPHRLARGQNFYNRARSLASRTHHAFKWTCALVPGVGHDNAGMADDALAFLVKGKGPEAGADCKAVR